MVKHQNNFGLLDGYKLSGLYNKKRSAT